MDRRIGVGALAFFAGSAALSWEVLWQHCTSLFIGASALGAAITLAIMMVGMTVGAALGGRVIERLREREPGSEPAKVLGRPLRVYAVLEATVGVSGLLLLPAFGVLARLDAWVFRAAPSALPWVDAIGLSAVLGVPAVAMGATLPALQSVARSYGASLSRLYGLNTLGAAFGALGLAFLAVPALGIELTAMLASTVNLCVALAAFLAAAPPEPTPADATPDAGANEPTARMPVDGRSYLIAFTTGFSIFALEVVWFRAMRAAFQSEMDAFAIMLCVVLLPLAVGAVLARRLARRAIPVEYVVGAAGAVVLLSTPLVERFDVLIKHPNAYLATVLVWFGTGLAIIGPAALVAGMPLPLLLDRTDDPRTVGRVYAVNTIGAALGSICTAWLLLPALGLARVSWLAGAALLGSALVVGGRTSRLRVTLAGAAALGIAIASEGGIGRLRVQGPSRGTAVSLLAYHEGPDSTVAVIEPSGAPRQLLIDGFTASSEKPRAQYMEWIGRLPMLLHPDPRDALVICYGTGQTANAVRNERVERLDVVELNAAVLSMAPLFRLGGDVLADRRTRAIVMDGRAWLRRTDRTYDVVTLEPMPPNFAGVNALYSVEFYELVASRLSRDGVVAQWVPFHLVTPEDATSIAATFVQVFPDALLWVAPADQTGILVGRRRGNPLPIGREWPGLKHAEATRSLSADEVLQNVALGPAELAYYAQAGSVITDDNQRLAYGRSRARKHFYRELITVANLQEVARSRSAR